MSIDSEIANPTNIEQHSTDVLIIGSGLAGMQVLNAIHKRSELNHLSVLLIDPLKTHNKTWCFWEEGKGQWEELIHKQWTSGDFIASSEKLDLQMDQYSYKMIRSTDFLEHFHQLIEKNDRFELIKTTISELEIEKGIAIGDGVQIKAKYIFDSRFDLDEIKLSDEPSVLQHFKGWFIRSSEDVFEPEKFTMMDFSFSLEDECSFIYLLPFSKNEALVEFTYFSPQLAEDETYDRLIKEYLDARLDGISYDLIDTEKGIIPMSTHNFQAKNSGNYCRIGTAGGWVKSSSGYSFKMAEKKSKVIAQNLIDGSILNKGLFEKRFRFYDKIFLNILENENALGNQLFQEMYQNNKASKIFRFLDEDSTLKEELKIISSFKSSPFLKAFRREFL